MANHGEEDAPDFLEQSPDDSERRFWTSQRRLTVAQWTGVALVFAAATAAVIGYSVRILMFILGPLVVFLVMGNLLAYRKKHGHH